MQKVAFLDRDGTINVDHGYVHRRSEWEFTAGAIPALSRLQSQGFALAVVTNQSGVARGRYDLASVEALHAWLRDELSQHHIQLAAIAVCPHAPNDDCQCRKPRAGMLTDVERQMAAPIDIAASWMIGDKLSDLGFGQAVGARTALITSRYWEECEVSRQADLRGDSLSELVGRILEGG